MFMDVRNSYRLLYNYQRRVMDLVEFIGKKLSFNVYEGYSKFSKARTGLKGSLDWWAWDWLGMYHYQFLFSQRYFEKDGKQNIISFSVILVSDTGFYDVGKANPLDVMSFEKVELSQSKLVFFLGKNKLIYTEYADFEKHNLSKNSSDYVVKGGDNEVLLAKSFDLNNFINEETTIKSIKEWIEFCHRNGVNEIEISQIE